jgi:hypothetical protein
MDICQVRMYRQTNSTAYYKAPFGDTFFSDGQYLKPYSKDTDEEYILDDASNGAWEITAAWPLNSDAKVDTTVNSYSAKLDLAVGTDGELRNPGNGYTDGPVLTP